VATKRALTPNIFAKIMSRLPRPRPDHRSHSFVFLNSWVLWQIKAAVKCFSAFPWHTFSSIY